jgi:hypothetical protein
VTGAGDPIVNAFSVFDQGSVPKLYLGGSFIQAGPHVSDEIGALRRCHHPGTPLCFGDGSIAACPCANTGAPGHGCENSIATGGAVLTADGWPSLAEDSLVFTSSGEIASALSILLQGSLEISPTPFGDGLRCAGGQLARLYVWASSGGVVTVPHSSDPAVSARSATLGDVIATGGTRVYQMYYRDPNLSFCPQPNGDGWNATQALRIQWLP